MIICKVFGHIFIMVSKTSTPGFVHIVCYCERCGELLDKVSYLSERNKIVDKL